MSEHFTHLLITLCRVFALDNFLIGGGKDWKCPDYIDEREGTIRFQSRLREFLWCFFEKSNLSAFSIQWRVKWFELLIWTNIIKISKYQNIKISKYQNIKIIANILLILTEDTFNLQFVFVHVQYVLMCNTHFPVFIMGSIPYRSKFLVSLGFLRHFSMDLCSLLLRLINK